MHHTKATAMNSATTPLVQPQNIHLIKTENKEHIRLICILNLGRGTTGGILHNYMQTPGYQKKKPRFEKKPHQY